VNISPKSPRIELSNDTVGLSNGKGVKFSHTNRKHFTVGDPMAFPIVKWGTKPQNPFPLHDVDPHLIQQCLGRPHAPPQTAAPTIVTVSHVRRKFPIGYNGAPKIRPNSTPSRGPIPKPNYLPHPWTRPTYDAKRHPDPIRHFSTMYWTDRPTHRQIVHGKV